MLEQKLMLFQITSRFGVPDIFKRRNIASFWIVPICWYVISDNFNFSRAASTQNCEALNNRVRWWKARVAIRPSRARVGRASAIIFPPAASLVSFLFSNLLDFSKFAVFWCLQYWTIRCLGESPSPKRIFGGAAKFAGFSLASPTMLGVTARSAVNHCGVPNTSLFWNELQLEYARSQIIHSSQFTKFNSAHG